MHAQEFGLLILTEGFKSGWRSFLSIPFLHIQGNPCLISLKGRRFNEELFRSSVAYEANFFIQFHITYNFEWYEGRPDWDTRELELLLLERFEPSPASQSCLPLDCLRLHYVMSAGRYHGTILLKSLRLIWRIIKFPLIWLETQVQIMIKHQTIPPR